MVRTPVPDYAEQALAYLKAGALQEAVWELEAALRDPRLAEQPQLADYEAMLASLWVERMEQTLAEDREKAERMLHRAVKLYRSSLTRKPTEKAGLLELARTLYRRFRLTDDHGDLLSANMALQQLEDFLQSNPDPVLLAALLAFRNSMRR